MPDIKSLYQNLRNEIAKIKVIDKNTALEIAENMLFNNPKSLYKLT